MLKKAGVFLLGLSLFPVLVLADTISFDQAGNAAGIAGIEIGANVDYSYEKIETEGVGETVKETTITEIPVFARLCLPILELKLTVPYGSVKTNAQAIEDKDYSGIKNIGLGIKSGLLGLPLLKLALGLNTNIPTGDPKQYLGGGLDLNPYVAADLDVAVMKLHAHLGYAYRGEYNMDMNSVAKEPVKLKPGNATCYGVGLEIPAGNLTFNAELLGYNYGEVKRDGEILKNAEGATFSFIPGVQLKAGVLRAKLGVAIPLEKQKDRPKYADRSDWRVLGSASLFFGI